MTNPNIQPNPTCICGHPQNRHHNRSGKCNCLTGIPSINGYFWSKVSYCHCKQFNDQRLYDPITNTLAEALGYKVGRTFEVPLPSDPSPYPKYITITTEFQLCDPNQERLTIL